ncbi:MAG: alpha/beta hydrolase [Planctomycetes bacterium]|jgi:pimeloyl-ACP methyl ester carboxylesterase|nr:alpha/beta hydrolase [Planctomycetota bacterium]
MILTNACLLPGLLALVAAQDGPDSLLERVEHGYADNDGVRIHFAALGEGPLIVMLHGFPDYWYTWRHQMEVLSHDYRVVALDLRGYNRSDKPKGIEAYSMRHLMGDVDAVIRDQGEESATVIGHDWGGVIAWQFAAWHPERVEGLVILNVPHPTGLSRGLADARGQRKASQYAYDFQKEGAHLAFTAKGLAGWVRDAGARAHYVEAFERSDFEAMLAYYKRNFPPPTKGKAAAEADAAPTFPRIGAPVLVLFGLKDRYLLSDGLNNTWDWIDGELTLVTFPKAGHFVQHDAAELVTRSMLAWLGR